MSECVIGKRIRSDGYARVPSGRRGRYFYAHRVAWEAEHGPIPEGMVIHHRCETKSCINVEHMELVAHREHMSRHRTRPNDFDINAYQRSWYRAADGAAKKRAYRRKRREMQL
jgi:HNH endonuclease